MVIPALILETEKKENTEIIESEKKEVIEAGEKYVKQEVNMKEVEIAV